MRPRPANREPQSAHNDLVKTEFTEVSETRKNLTFEIPSDVVDAEIDRVAKGYSRTVRVPGFRPGKVPAAVVRQRYKDQILYDVAHDLIPRLVGDALRERGLEPVATPDIKDVSIEEGQPLKFVADFETLPPIDPGEYTGVMLRKEPAVLEVGAVDQAIERLRQQAARWHPVEDRPAAAADTLLMDLTRTVQPRLIQLAGESAPPPGRHRRRRVVRQHRRHARGRRHGRLGTRPRRAMACGNAQPPRRPIPCRGLQGDRQRRGSLG